MSRFAKVIILAAGLMVFTAQASLAASPHFKKDGTPVCTITYSGTNSTSTTCTGTLAGLSGADLTVFVTVSGSAVYTCTNGGGNDAAGQNKVLVGPSTTPSHLSGGETKNGNLTFNTDPALLSAPSQVSGAAAGCPNPNWTGTNPKLTITSIRLQISYDSTPTTFFYDQTRNVTGTTVIF